MPVASVPSVLRLTSERMSLGLRLILAALHPTPPAVEAFLPALLYFTAPMVKFALAGISDAFPSSQPDFLLFHKW